MQAAVLLKLTFPGLSLHLSFEFAFQCKTIFPEYLLAFLYIYIFIISATFGRLLSMMLAKLFPQFSIKKIIVKAPKKSKQLLKIDLKYIFINSFMTEAVII